MSLNGFFVGSKVGLLGAKVGDFVVGQLVGLAVVGSLLGFGVGA